MVEYNIGICKRNIKEIMDSKKPKITQNELAKHTGIPQPQISKNLAEDKSNFFTVQQLVSIANYLQVSVDDLLGTPQSQKGTISNSIGTLSDLAEILFTLNKQISLKFENVITEETEDDFPKSRTAMYFDNPSIERLISEWKKIIESTKDIECRNELLTLWEKDRLGKLKEYLAENDYMGIDEYSREICSEHLKHIDDDDYTPFLSNHEIDVIEYYLKVFPHELESFEYGFLKRMCSRAKWNNIPDGIDDILPFD